MNSEKACGARWLLLLPQCPRDISMNTIEVAYKPSISRLLYKASKQTATDRTPSIVDIGVAYSSDRSTTFHALQTLFGICYGLSTSISSKSQIDVGHDNDVDVRFFLYDPSLRQGAKEAVYRLPKIATLDTLAGLGVCWHRICGVESEAGEEILQDFLQRWRTFHSLSVTEPGIERVPGGLTLSIASPGLDEQCSDDRYSTPLLNSSVAVGGTFDHIHAGHKVLLTMTALALDVSSRSKPGKLTIGITGDALLAKKAYIEYMESWETRQDHVRQFLTDMLSTTLPGLSLLDSRTESNSSDKAREVTETFNNGLVIHYVEIFDPFGPTITESSITALVISAETRSGGDAVNQKRKDRGWTSLAILEVDVLDSTTDEAQGLKTEDAPFQSKISSTHIRSQIHTKHTG